MGWRLQPVHRDLHPGPRRGPGLLSGVLKERKVHPVIRKGASFDLKMFCTVYYNWFSGLASQVVGAVHQPLPDRLHRGRDHRQAGEHGPGRVQPHGGLRHVPGRGDHLPLRLGREERQPEAAAVPRPQRPGAVDGPLAHPGRLPLLLG